MSKQITPRELASIVSTLLIHPDYVGELAEAQTYMRFMEAIGAAVADHCGGDVSGVSGPNCAHAEALAASRSAESTVDDGYMLAVHPNDALPDIASNIWSAFDPEGWEDETGGADRSENIATFRSFYAAVLDADMASSLTNAIQQCVRTGSIDDRNALNAIADRAFPYTDFSQVSPPSRLTMGK